MALWARIVGGRVVQIVNPQRHDKLVYDRLVEVSARPDIKVGTTWPFKTEQQAIDDGDLKEPGVLPEKAGG